MQFPKLTMTTLLCSIAIAAGADAQGQYEFTIDRNQSNFSWTLTTNLGVVNGIPDNLFTTTGHVDNRLNLPQSPFFTGEFNGGAIATDPNPLVGNLSSSQLAVDIEIRDLVFKTTSPLFTIVGTSWDTDVTLEITNGEIWANSGGFSITESLIGELGSGRSAGAILQSGSRIRLTVPINVKVPVSFQIFGQPITGDLQVAGTLVAEANTTQTMSLSVGDLVAGQPGDFLVTHGAPNQTTWLAYSLQGIQLTPVNQLGVVLGLRRPAQAGPTRHTDGTGAVSWTLPIPGNASGTNLWLQTAQVGQTSNVVATRVR